MDVQIILGLLTAMGVGAVLLETVRAVFTRKKMSADTAKILVEAANTLVEPLREEVQTLRIETKKLKDERDTLEHELSETLEMATSLRQELQMARSEIGLLREALADGRGPTTTTTTTTSPDGPPPE
jgi:predicted  nucleic acid-binding Zn-ribbon protein